MPFTFKNVLKDVPIGEMESTNTKRFKNRAKLYVKPKDIGLKVFLIGLLYTILRTVNPLMFFILTPLIKIVYDILRDQKNLKEFAQDRVLQVAEEIPIVNVMVKHEIDGSLKPIIAKMEQDEFKHRSNSFRFLELPKEGVEKDKILAELSTVDSHIKNPHRISGAVYAPYESRKFKTEVYQRVALTNPMHSDLWKTLPYLEAQAIQMTLNLYHAPKGAWGSITAGGTMSIYSACKAYRDSAKDFLWPVSYPEIIASDRVHPAFDKACHILGIKLIKIPTHMRNMENREVDIKAMEEAISYNTIALVASAPQFPEGHIENVSEIAKLASDYDVGCHVDACLGGFCLPFAHEMGYLPYPIDFRLKGVTSISADFHKYGMSEKGESAVMYFSYESLGKYQTHVHLESSIGLYATLGIEGSRQPRIDSWATLLATGSDGYKENLRKMIAFKDDILYGISKLNGIKVSGKPVLPIFVIESKDDNINILLVASKMKEKGWEINGLPNPNRLHFCITPTHLGTTLSQDFLKDLEYAVDYAKKNQNEKPKGTLGMYDLLNEKVPKGIKAPIHKMLGWSFLRILGQAKPFYNPEEDIPRPQRRLT